MVLAPPYFLPGEKIISKRGCAYTEKILPGWEKDPPNSGVQKVCPQMVEILEGRILIFPRLVKNKICKKYKILRGKFPKSPGAPLRENSGLFEKG